MIASNYGHMKTENPLARSPQSSSLFSCSPGPGNQKSYRFEWSLSLSTWRPEERHLLNLQRQKKTRLNYSFQKVWNNLGRFYLTKEKVQMLKKTEVSDTFMSTQNGV